MSLFQKIPTQVTASSVEIDNFYHHRIELIIFIIMSDIFESISSRDIFLRYEFCENFHTQCMGVFFEPAEDHMGIIRVTTISDSQSLEKSMLWTGNPERDIINNHLSGIFFESTVERQFLGLRRNSIHHISLNKSDFFWFSWNTHREYFWEGIILECQCKCLLSHNNTLTSIILCEHFSNNIPIKVLRIKWLRCFRGS